MRKLISTLLLIGLGWLATAAGAIWAALTTDRGVWLLLLPAGVLAEMGVIVALGLRGSRGGLLAFLRGQLPPPVRSVPRSVHLAVDALTSSAPAEVSVDLSCPVAQVGERFVSVAVDIAQVVGGKWWNPAADGIELSYGSLQSPVFVSYAFSSFRTSGHSNGP
jgi:hypothetical protein